uniref:Uncharacterized protein n=1 Tax=Knipowitschia caucasica TaxID=637954 RepID=A0AAV2JSS6_KNICA
MSPFALLWRCVRCPKCCFPHEGEEIHCGERSSLSRRWNYARKHWCALGSLCALRGADSANAQRGLLLGSCGVLESGPPLIRGLTPLPQSREVSWVSARWKQASRSPCTPSLYAPPTAPDVTALEDERETPCAVAPTSPEQDSPVDLSSSLDLTCSLDLVSLVQDHNPPDIIQVPPSPEHQNLQDFSTSSATVGPIERAVPPETQDISSNNAHFLVSTMIQHFLNKSPVFLDIREQGRVILQLREVERRVSMPQGTDLKTKDLKAIAKETARSLREELGPFTSPLLWSEYFLNSAVRHLNFQLEDFFDEDRGRRPERFFSRVFKLFRIRRNRVSPGPLRAYIRSAF